MRYNFLSFRIFYLFCLFVSFTTFYFFVPMGLSYGKATEGEILILSEEQRKSVNDLSLYFNKIRSLMGQFIQVGPTGRTSEGDFVLSKPGRLRFQYASPNPYEIISDGQWLMVRNRESDVSDYYPLDVTPLHFVLSDDIDILRDAKIIDVDYSNGSVLVTLEDKNVLVPGRLILFYDPRKQALQKWVIIDGAGRRTTISITHHLENIPVDDALFFVPAADRGFTNPDRGR